MKRNALLDYNRLPMEKAFNVRELGGYAARKGSVTKYHQFLRTDNLTDITEEDKNFLLGYGVRAVIDLRGREETLIYPNPFREHPDVTYINLPFITDTVLDMRAVKEAGVKPEDITYINAHGTSTHHNDLFETIAIKSALGDAAKDVVVNSTKSMIGHLLGAAGGVEFVTIVKSVEEGFIHQTVGTENVDEECDLNYAVGAPLAMSWATREV